MQTFPGQFYLNGKTFALGSQILFPVVYAKALYIRNDFWFIQSCSFFYYVIYSIKR